MISLRYPLRFAQLTITPPPLTPEPQEEIQIANPPAVDDQVEDSSDDYVPLAHAWVPQGSLYSPTIIQRTAPSEPVTPDPLGPLDAADA